MFGLGSIKWAAIGAAVLAGLTIIWRILAHQESLGAAKEKVKQQKAANDARKRIDDVKPEADDAIINRADRGEF